MGWSRRMSSQTSQALGKFLQSKRISEEVLSEDGESTASRRMRRTVPTVLNITASTAIKQRLSLCSRRTDQILLLLHVTESRGGTQTTAPGIKRWKLVYREKNGTICRLNCFKINCFRWIFVTKKEDQVEAASSAATPLPRSQEALDCNPRSYNI